MFPYHVRKFQAVPRVVDRKEATVLQFMLCMVSLLLVQERAQRRRTVAYPVYVRVPQSGFPHFMDGKPH